MERLRPGTRFGDLVVERELGRGAFGRVYLAEDTLIGRKVALKIVHRPGSATDEAERSMVLREVRAAGRFNSENIVTLFRVHPPQQGDTWAFEFEYVSGGTLQQHLGDRTALPADRARAIARNVANALRLAHAAQVVHGDVKPGNVLLGSGGRVKLTDFGLSRFLGDLSLHLSSEAGPVGTPLFMAPEVLLGERPTPASDVWSFGVMMYRVLAGRLPFEAMRWHGLFYAIEHAEPPPLPSSTPADLGSVCAACLCKQPRDRPESGAALLELLDGEAARRAPPLTPPPREVPATRLWGRDRELATLEGFLDAACTSGAGGAALLTGGPGIGKSALIDHIAQVARHREISWIEAHVTAVEGVLRPLLRSLEHSVPGVPADAEAEPASATRRQIRKLLEESAELRLELRQDALATLDQALRAAREVSPVVIAIEEVHECNAEDAQLLRHLVLRLPERGIVLLMTARTAAEEEAPAKLLGGPLPETALLRLSLRRLDRADAYELLKDRVHGAHVSPRVANRIFEVAEGNPLFTRVLLDHLLESAGVTLDATGLVAGPRWEEVDLPSRLRDLVAHRVAGLSDEERSLLDVAAVSGMRFDGEELAGLTDRSQLPVLRTLQRVYRHHGLIVPRQQGFRFASAVVQEVLYRELAPDLRRALHRGLAEHLERRAESGAEETERLAVQWEGAGEPGRAEPYFRQAALGALRRQEMQRAIALATRGGMRPGGLEPGVVREHADLLLGLMGFYYEQGQNDEARSAYDDLLRAVEHDPDSTLELRARTRREDWRSKEEGAAACDLELLKRASRELPPCFEKVKAHYLLGLVAKDRGDLQGHERHLADAQEAASGLGHRGMLSSILDQLGSLALRRGDPEEAEKRYAVAARLSEQAGRRTNAAVSEVNRILAAFTRGSDEPLAPALKREIGAFELEGVVNLAEHTRLVLAEVHFADGEVEEAERCVDRALAELERRKYRAGLDSARLLKASLRVIRGDLPEGEALLRRSIEDASEGGSLQVRVEMLAWLARCLCHGGRPDEALKPARLAYAAAEQSDDGRLRAQLVGSLAESALTGLALERVGRLKDLLTLPGRQADVASALLTAAVSWVGTDGDARSLQTAADTLRSVPGGARRSEKLLLAELFGCEADTRDGNLASARQAVARALREAERLRHVWFELLLRRIAHRLGDPRAGFEERLGAVASRIPEESRQRVLVTAWRAGGRAPD